MAYYKAGDNEQALTWLSKAKTIAQQKNINDASIYNTLGYIYMLNGDKAKARATFEEGVAIDNNNAKLLNNYGSLLLSEGNYAMAEQQFEKASALGYAKAKENLSKVKTLNKAITK